jgi:hypothetical protein
VHEGGKVDDVDTVLQGPVDFFKARLGSTQALRSALPACSGGGGPRQRAAQGRNQAKDASTIGHHAGEQEPVCRQAAIEYATQGTSDKAQ